MERIIGVDLARFIALAGIIFVHTNLSTDENFGIFETLFYLFGNGVAPALFAVLMGLSLQISSKKHDNFKNFKAHTSLRAFFIFFIGLALGAVGSPIAIILVNLAVLSIIGLAFIHISEKRLLMFAAVAIIAGPVITFLVRANNLVEAFNFEVFTMESFNAPLLSLEQLFFTGYYPLLHWIGYFLLGMGITKALSATRRTRNSLGIFSLFLGLITWSLGALYAELKPLKIDAKYGDIVLGFYGTPPLQEEFLLSVVPHGGTPFTGIVMASISVSVILLSLALGYRFPKALPIKVLASIGAVSLTVYTLHVAFMSALPIVGNVPDSFIVQMVFFILLGFSLSKTKAWTLEHLIQITSRELLKPSSKH